MPVQKDPVSGIEFITAGETKNPKNILVVLHGMGDTCHGMEQAGESFAQKLPGTLVLIPHAPAMDGIFRPSSLNAFIDSQLSSRKIPDSALAIYGFSAGGTVALESALYRKKTCAGVVSHSGFAANVAGGGSSKAPSATPPVLLIFGDQELKGFHAKALFWATKKWLKHMDRVPLKQYICKNLGHAVNNEAISVASQFISEKLGLAPQQKQQPQPTPTQPKQRRAGPPKNGNYKLK